MAAGALPVVSGDMAARPCIRVPRPRLDPTTALLARGQHGALTTRQLRAVGQSEGAILDLVSSGVLEHPGRGLYLAVEQLDEGGLGRYRALAAGAFLMYPDAVLAGEAALVAHGVTVWGSTLEVPALLRPVKRSGGMSAFWVRPVRGTTVDSEWGAATPVAEALAQHAVDHGIGPGVVSADHALHSGLVTEQALGAAVASVAGYRNGSRAASMLAHSDGLRESVGESRTALALALGGIEVESQVVIRDGQGRFVARSDFRVRGTNVLVEFDGRLKYDSGDPSVLWREKKREDRLRGLGYVIVRVTWAQLEVPGLVPMMVARAVRYR